MVVQIIILSCCSAILYRLGGSAKRGDFFDFLRNKLTRRLGCAILQFITIFFILKISAPLWVHFLSIGITYGFLTTYYDFINGDDSHWLHGLGIGFGMILYAFVGAISWPMLVIRVGILAVVMGVWSKYWKHAVIEELGRGFFIVASLPLLLGGI